MEMEKNEFAAEDSKEDGERFTDSEEFAELGEETKSTPDKRIKFEQLAERRVSQALKDLQSIANLANRTAYDFDATHVDEITSALDYELEKVKEKFRSSLRDTKAFSFSFKKAE